MNLHIVSINYKMHELFNVAPVRTTFNMQRNVIAGNVLNAIDYAKSK